MRILITTCGVGIGHASRDLALAKLLKTRGHDVKFASYGSGLHYLQKNKCDPYELPSMNFQGNEGVINVNESLKQSKDIPFTFIKSMYKDAKIIRKTKPDLIITDCDYSAPITAKFLNIPCYIITSDLTFGFADESDAPTVKYFEKSVRKIIIEISKGCQQILIPDIPGSITIPQELKHKSEFIGPLLHKNITEIESKEKLRKKYNLKQDDIILVVTIGGSEFGKPLVSNICDIADKINVDTIFIFTGLEINPASFNLKDNQTKIKIKQFTHNLMEWMMLSDLTVALAGHTTSMELLTIQKPNILIALENHVEQQRNVERMKKYNLTKTTSINDKKDLLNKINTLLENKDKIKLNQEAYDYFIQFNGRENALNLIEKINI
ncbi:UDP-N-acetylglucosamine--N-acetylmuramyl-(pentapeptide) pyrophosphoryl-undecaprenol N-acetylglucosamine transferase [Methanosphaera sp. WGK6]|uniref:UDP-N-acetylglucosamine--N-acetylmuramyl- (pentapeptide) pyrophosphoryl-undecaprenol N-acetylglucosamine transferase n=1 Tax=Methanosphaera sp. WGK6 TaxID=1561964 RepID=UPI00084C76BC|nr:UDP-N-acetylglucosamine--N-acetylmuramyl-(pentapeptide) pyrophosphoryl-undecaprenol N-acetylglucosamine transferase [Methanosphaera sp. WGK6]OED29870.1 hypothetical protein NL43_06170 [Methanosphaera sp. WGK6]